MTEHDDFPAIDPALLRGLTQRRLSRRDLFRTAGIGAGALSLGAILASCGVSGGGGSGGGSASPAAAIDWNAAPSKTLNFANWPLYLDKKKDPATGQIVHPSLQRFTKDTGIQVQYDEVIQANAGFFGKIQPNLAAGEYVGWDIIVITNGDTLNKLFSLNYLVELPTDKRPNFDKYAGDAVKSPAYDDGNKFTMAWQSGLTGIGWDPVQVKALRPSNPTITSMNDLYDPAFKGKVGMFADNADMPNLAMLGLGIVPEDSTPDDWQQTADKLTQQRDDGIVRQYYEQNYIQALGNGDLAVSMAWSGDIFQTNVTGDPNGLQFAVPTEGAIIWTDNMCIPIGVEHPVDAITMMDYVYKPEIQAIIEDYNNYICPVPDAQAIIKNQLKDPEVANSPLVFPTPDIVARLHSYRVLTDEELVQWNALFQPIYLS
jgi:spermidine/putrescine transport system substrate-binding protein